MNIELEHRLHRDLTEMATRADVATVELAGVMSRVGRRRRRRAVARAATALAGVVLVVGGLVAVSTRGGSDDLDAASPDAGPTRTEVPLTRLQQVVARGVTKGEPVGFELSDGSQLTFSVMASSFFDTYYQSTCRSMSGETSCWPVESSVELDPLPWTRPELAGNNDMVIWIGLPTSVVRAELRQGGNVLWQQVVDGVAAFPVDHHDPTDEVVGFDASGLELLRTTWSTVSLVGESTTVSADGSTTEPMYTWSSTFATERGDFEPEVDISTMEGMTQADEEAYRAFADAAMRQCLVDQGAAAWNGCLVSTEAAVKGYLADRP